MSQWVVVGEEHSGDEDDNVSETEAFGPFETNAAAGKWLDSAPTFDGRVVRLRDPNVNAKGSA